ncbi:winged helix-turn-helix transcriptional regulator [Candidatus Woesearchaeota archaeon]|nr:winged helix-turn-helix transcriptional regulator [Candidatus Woesearchaeota archaeon]
MGLFGVLRNIIGINSRRSADNSPITSDEKAVIEQLTLDGVSTLEISRRIGRSQSAVWEYVNKLKKEQQNEFEKRTDALELARLEFEHLKVKGEGDVALMELECKRLELQRDIEDLKQDIEDSKKDKTAELKQLFDCFMPQQVKKE